MAVMAIEPRHTQTISLRHLPTRSVTLFPHRAQIVRDIKDITIQPGRNQIVIRGLSPTIDEQRVKVECSGAATITDVSVYLVQNEDYWDEPESDSDSDSVESESDQVKKSIQAKITELNVKYSAEKEKINSADTCRSELIDLEGDSSNQVHLKDHVSAYLKERQKVHQYRQAAILASNTIDDQLLAAGREKLKLERRWKTRNTRRETSKLRSRNKRLEEREKERLRVQKEMMAFWPKKVYQVTINLEATAGFDFDTPTSSRRSSIVEVATPNGSPNGSPKNLDTSTFQEPQEPPGTQLPKIDLSLSYMTYSANWSPRYRNYNLSLNTEKGTGLLEYSAALWNGTSETWKDAKFTLSTLQTTFTGLAGLSEEIPVLEPWAVCLEKGAAKDGGVMSKEETDAKKESWKLLEAKRGEKRKWEGFGDKGNEELILSKRRKTLGDPFQSPTPTPNPGSSPYVPFRGSYELVPNWDNFGFSPVPASPRSFGSGNYKGTPLPPALTGRTFGAKDTSAVDKTVRFEEPMGFGTVDRLATKKSEPAVKSISTSGRDIFGPVREMAAAAEAEARGKKTEAEIKATEFREPTSEAQPAFSFPNSQKPSHNEDPDLDREPHYEELTFDTGVWEDPDSTMTYDVPGPITLPPGRGKRAHKLGKIPFTDINFSHIIIPKFRSVAFLEARLENTSGIPLFQGPLGLTLDKTFLGRTTFPPVSPGESLTFPLGTDPSIVVGYAKPVVTKCIRPRRLRDSSIFTRVITIQNTKDHGPPVAITVLDQIPVSEDKRLKIEFLKPAGLKEGGEALKTGELYIPHMNGSTVAPPAGEDEEKWGEAYATLKEEGRVSWEVKLNPGQGVKLMLKYEASFPAGEGVVDKC